MLHADIDFGGSYSASSDAYQLMIVCDTLKIQGNPRFAGVETGALPVELLLPRIVE
jgi:hypothetical protein